MHGYKWLTKLVDMLKAELMKSKARVAQLEAAMQAASLDIPPAGAEGAFGSPAGADGRPKQAAEWAIIDSNETESLRLQLAESNKEQSLLREDLADVRRELEERNASLARSAADEEAQLRQHDKEKAMMKKMAAEVLRLRAEAVKKDDLARLAIASIKQQQAKLALPEVRSVSI